MLPVRASKLLTDLCAVPELIPDWWNVVEPIDIPFKVENLRDVVSALVPSPPQDIRRLGFFVRKRWPGFLMSLDLRIAPVQWTTAHNCISLKFHDEWVGGEHTLAQYISRALLPKYADYASVPDWSQEPERYAELSRSYTATEFGDLFRNKKSITTPFGPYGCLADVHWFNYFGRVYVELIGKARLMEAGWARVEEIGEGLACYATQNIDDRNSRERRTSITKAIEEFIWTPGCKPEHKHIVNFDFSEQFAALPSDLTQEANQSPDSVRLHFAGLTAKEQEAALRALDKGGKKK
jgi:hypothetical protein